MPSSSRDTLSAWEGEIRKRVALDAEEEVFCITPWEEEGGTGKGGGGGEERW